MTHFLDTHVRIAAMRGNPKIVPALVARSADDCGVSMIRIFERSAGVFRCKRPDREGKKVSPLLEAFHLLPIDLLPPSRC